MRKYFVIFCVFVMVFSLIQCNKVSGVSTIKGGKAADFTVKDLQGNDVGLSEYLGKEPVLLVFFATWCPPCRKEVPQLVGLNNSYSSKGLKMVAVSLDNSPNVLPDFIQKNGINYAVWHDGYQKAAPLYNIVGIPTNILINRDGVITFREHSPPPAKEIESILN